jgi:hypothetical protein
MSETYTEDFLIYTSIIVGYSLNKDKFIKFIKKISLNTEYKEYEIYNTNHLSKVNEILFRDNIIFHFNGEKSVLGVKIKDFGMTVAEWVSLPLPNHLNIMIMSVKQPAEASDIDKLAIIDTYRNEDNKSITQNRIVLKLGLEQELPLGCISVCTGKSVYDITVFASDLLNIGSLAKVLSKELEISDRVMIFVYKGKKYDESTFMLSFQSWLPIAKVMLRFDERFWKSKEYLDYIDERLKELTKVEANLQHAGRTHAIDAQKSLQHAWKEYVERVWNTVSVIETFITDPKLLQLKKICRVILDRK